MADKKYARARFYDVALVDGTQQLDLLSFSWVGFKSYIKNRSVINHTLSAYEVGRLDLIAYKYYGDVQLWWIIAQANSIIDPIDGMSAGDILVIPSLRDVEDYNQAILNRRRKGATVDISSRTV